MLLRIIVLVLFACVALSAQATCTGCNDVVSGAFAANDVLCTGASGIPVACTTTDFFWNSGLLDVAGDISLTGSTNRALNIGNGILTISTNNPNQAFLNATGFWFLRIGGVDKINVSAGLVAVNEAGVDVDFRVESNTNENMLFVDGGANQVGIGIGNPGIEEVLDIRDPAPIIRIRDSNATTAVLTTGFIEIGHDVGGIFTRHAYMGYGSSSHDDMVLGNESSGGHVRFDLTATGNLGIGGGVPNHKLHVEGAIQMGDEGTKPTCAAGERGTLWHDFGGAGVKDDVEICAKAADDAYAWRTLY